MTLPYREYISGNVATRKVGFLPPFRVFVYFLMRGCR